MFVTRTVLRVDSRGVQSSPRVSRWLCRFCNQWYRVRPIKITMSDRDEIFQRVHHVYQQFTRKLEQITRIYMGLCRMDIYLNISIQCFFVT